MKKRPAYPICNTLGVNPAPVKRRNVHDLKQKLQRENDLEVGGLRSSGGTPDGFPSPAEHGPETSKRARVSAKSRRIQNAREFVSMLWMQNPKASYKEIVELADNHSIAIPWKDCHSWQTAWWKNESAVKTLLAKARRKKQDTT